MSSASNAIKTGLFTLLVPLIVGVGIPQRIIAARRDELVSLDGLRLVGILLIVLGSIGYFWFAALFVKEGGTPAPIFPTKRTVVNGLYRINRNPMYTSVLAVVFGQALLYQNERVAAYGAFLFVCFHLFVVFYEERALRTQFDGEYEGFYQRVPRWIPRLTIFSRRSR